MYVVSSTIPFHYLYNPRVTYMCIYSTIITFYFRFYHHRSSKNKYLRAYLITSAIFRSSNLIKNNQQKLINKVEIIIYSELEGSKVHTDN